MKVRIIKRTEHEEARAEIPATSGRSKHDEARSKQAMTSTVKSWIDELREKREAERLMFQRLFKEELPC